MKLKEGNNKFALTPNQEVIALPKTPECEKIHAVKDRSQSIGEFLDWLKERRVHLAIEHIHCDGCYEDGDCVCGVSNNELVTYIYNVESLLAEFFNIDLKKVDKEKRALLDAVRAGA